MLKHHLAFEPMAQLDLEHVQYPGTGTYNIPFNPLRAIYGAQHTYFTEPTRTYRYLSGTEEPSSLNQGFRIQVRM